MNDNRIMPIDELYLRSRETKLRRIDYQCEVRLEKDRRLQSTAERAKRLERETDHHLVKALAINVYGEDAKTKHLIRFPSDWWQAIKERFAPAWFRDKYPVRFTEICASLQCTYPDFKPQLPDEPYVVKVMVLETPSYPLF